jgi:4-hydroxybenzoate polyprenyltransferase
VGTDDRDDWQERYEASLREDDRLRGAVKTDFWEDPATRYMLTSGAFFIVTFAVGFIVSGLWWVVAIALVVAAGVGCAFFIAKRRRGSEG